LREELSRLSLARVIVSRMTDPAAATPPPDDLRRGPDGRLRCGWGAKAPEYVAYHDVEWGRPVHDDIRLFEKLCLEGFQAGLSWLTILRKREAFRRAFAGFDPAKVAAFGDADVARLLADASIIRSRAKIEAAIANGKAMLALGDTTLDELVWTHAPPPRPAPTGLHALPASTPESKALAKELKRRGFRFVGATTVYAMMQACGVVNDHLAGCFVREELARQEAARPPA
jgi:DNA-3-methyladenine glycosylase I